MSRWEVDLHHNNHIHPASYVVPGTSGSFLAENHDDGTGVFYGIRFLVTDTGGLVGHLAGHRSTPRSTSRPRR